MLATQTLAREPRPEELTPREAFFRQNLLEPQQILWLLLSQTLLPREATLRAAHVLPGPTSPRGKAGRSLETRFPLHPDAIL